MSVRRLQVAGGLALATLLALNLAWGTLVSPSIAFVRQDRDALWIARAEPVSMRAFAAPLDRLPAVEFAKRFELASAAKPLRVRIEALRGFELELNGRRVAERAWNEGNWKRAETVELADGLAAGENRLVVRVRNPFGPPLVRLEAVGDGVRLATDPSWETDERGEATLPARRASDRLRPAEVSATPALLEGARAKRDALLCAFVGAGLLSLAARSARMRAIRWNAAWIWVPIVAWWIFVFAFRAVRLPEYVGFDGPDHLAYVRYVLERGALPLANEGAQTYHPPLFYVVSAALLGLADGTLPARVVLRIVPFASGLALVAVAYALARRLFPADRTKAAVCAVAAALMPVNVYMSAYLSNEPLHAALAAASLLAATACLLAPRPPVSHVALAGALLGLAILGKVTSLLLVPVVGGCLAVRDWRGDARRAATACLRAALFAAVVLAVCGWFFARNRLELGRFLVGNWNLPGTDATWWQAPGFHTPAYYLGFGSGLRRPFFSGLESFWDGLYATFWGDGFAAGVAAWSYRHPLWDYDFIGATYLLALPATGLLLFGGLRLVREALRTADAGRRAALSCLVTATVVTVYVVLYMTLVHPVYSMTKASYALAVAPVLALALAEGATALHRTLDAPGRRALLLLFHGWAGALVASIVLSFAG